MKAKYLLILCCVIGALSGCCRLVCDNSYEGTTPRYVAHAGGVIDGYTYTNSIEAVMQSVDCGIKFIELDLDTTTDGHLVCLHDWEFFNHASGSGDTDSAMSYEDFLETRIFGRYTPMTVERILEIWKEHPQLWLVTDKISDPDIIMTNFAGISDRVVVECFSREDYFTLQKAGYVVFLSEIPPLPADTAASGTDTLQVDTGLWYVFHYSCFRTDRNFSRCALFTVHDRHSADSLFLTDPRIDLVYVDEL